MQGLIHQLEQLAGFTELRENLSQEQPLRAAGLVGGAKAILAVSIFRRLHRTVLVVTPSTRRAEQWYDDLHALLATHDEELAPPIRLFPSLPTLLGGDGQTDRQTVGQRLDAMESLLRGDPQLVVAPLSALLHRTIPPSAMMGSDLAVEVGQEIEPEAFCEQLEELGYSRHEPVIMPGQCTRRGGIVDVFPMTSPSPLRVEFWGDAIESIRYFDVNSQRSTKPQERFTITVSRESVRTKALSAETIAEIARAADNQADRLGGAGRSLEAKRLRAKVTADLKKLESEEPFDGSDHYLPFLYDEVSTLCDYLTKGSVVLVDDPNALGERSAELADEVGQVYRNKLNTGALVALPAPLYLRYRLDEPLWHKLPTIYLTPDDKPAEPAPEEVAVGFDFQPIEAVDGQLDQAIERVREWQEKAYRLLCTTHQVGRLEQILSSHGVTAFDSEEYDVLPTPGWMHIINQRLSAGFVIPSMKLAVITDHEVFGWHPGKPGGGASGQHGAGQPLRVGDWRHGCPHQLRRRHLSRVGDPPGAGRRARVSADRLCRDRQALCAGHRTGPGPEVHRTGRLHTGPSQLVRWPVAPGGRESEEKGRGRGSRPAGAVRQTFQGGGRRVPGRHQDPAADGGGVHLRGDAGPAQGH